MKWTLIFHDKFISYIFSIYSAFKFADEIRFPVEVNKSN